MLVPFHDRRDAGRRLAAALAHHAGQPETLVLALPRGGVPVAYEVAMALGVELDIILVRKLGVPGQEELAMGAIASGGPRVLNRAVIEDWGIGDDVVDTVSASELRELERRERAYRGGLPAAEVRGRPVILVDDGLATGASMVAAASALRQREPARITVAVPVGAQASCAGLRRRVDEVVCVLTPETFVAVGEWYADFRQTSDEEVRELLAAARDRLRAGGGDE